MREPAPPGVEVFGLLRFNRQEIAGSLGDLGTLLPIAIGLIIINGLNATAVILMIGLYYVCSGLYFRTTVPVQPMKVIGAYAIARGLPAEQITASGLWIGVLLLVLAATGAITLVSRIVPKSAVRGVQLTTGMLLMTQGIHFMLGDTQLQITRGAPEPNLTLSHLGPVPIGLLLGGAAIIAILALLENKRAPAALVVIIAGFSVGLVLYRPSLLPLDIGFHVPETLPFGLPDAGVATLALLTLALPQIPMTIGNAVIAQHDLTREYFGESVAKRASPRALAISMALANLAAFLVGGMPMCHGAGGLATHYRFGARTAASNLMIGAVFVLVGLLVGDEATKLLGILPWSVLGALLIFGGAQLALTLRDVGERRDLFVALIMLGVSLASNLAIGFLVGIGLALAFKYARLEV